MSAKDIKGQSHGSNTTEKQPAQQKLVPPAQITKSPPAPSKTNGNDTSPELDEEGDSDASGKEDEVSAAEESNNGDSGEDGESSDDQSESSDDSDDSDDGDDGESEAQPATSETISHQAKADMSEKASPKEEFEKEEEEEEEEEEEDDDDDEEEEDDDEEEEEEEEEDDDDDDEEEEEEEDSGENKADSLVVKTPAPEIQESAPDTSSSSSSSSGEEEEDKQDSHDQSTEKPISSEKEEGEEVDGENAKNGDNPAEPPAGKALKVPEDPEEDGFSSSDDSVEDIPGVLPPDIEAEFPPEESEEEAEEEEEETRDAMQVDAYAIPQTGDGEDAYAVPDSPIREKHPVPSKQPVAVKKRSHKRVPKKSILESDTPGDTPDETPKDTVQAETLALPTEKAQTITSPTRVQTPKKVPATLTTDITEATGATQTSQAPQTPQLAQIATPSRTQSTGRRRQSAPGSNSVFSDEEIAHIEEAAAMFRDERDITQQAFNEMVQDSATKHKELWTSLIDACGLKPRKSVLLRCRRMFHNFKEMYRWTAEEDEELAELVAEHGHKWVVISGILNRHREDVRKRWEERVVCRDDGRLFSWTFEEEKRLAKVVGEMAQIIEESRGKTAERRAANTGGIDPQTVTDISWAQVSERMGHTRTARQCRVKWADIEETYHFNDAGEFVGPPEPKELTRWQKRAMTMASRDWKTRGSRPKSAGGGRSFVRDVGEDGEQVPETSRHISDKVRRQLRQMSSTEKYRLVASIRESDVIHEEKIPWTRLVDETFRNQWRRPTRELVWSRLKRTVPDFHNKTVRQISQHLVDEYELHRQLGDGWELDYGGEESMESETEERPQKKRKHSKTEKATEKGRKGRKGQSEKPPKAYKSSDMAVDEDEGEEEEEERMPKDAEFEATLSGHRHRKRGKGDVPESDNEATDRRRSRRVDKTPSQRVVMEEDEEEEEEVQGTQGSKRGRRNSVDLGVDAKTTGPDPGPKRKMGLINGVGAKKRRIR